MYSGDPRAGSPRAAPHRCACARLSPSSAWLFGRHDRGHGKHIGAGCLPAAMARGVFQGAHPSGRAAGALPDPFRGPLPILHRRLPLSSLSHVCFPARVRPATPTPSAPLFDGMVATAPPPPAALPPPAAPSPRKGGDPLAPPPHLAAAAAARGETAATRAAGLAALRAHLAAEAAATTPRPPPAHARFLTALSSDAPFLLAFLRWARFSLPAATARLARFTAFVAAHPDWAARPSAADVSAVFGAGVLAYTPCADDRGRAVATLAADGGALEALIARVGLATVNRVAFWAHTALLRSPGGSIGGVVQVLALRGLGWGVLRQLRSPAGLAGYATLSHVLPLRLGGVTVVEPPPVMGLLLRLARGALSPKLRARVALVGGLAEVRGVDAACLPVELGGGYRGAAEYTVALVMDGVAAAPWMEVQ